MEKLILTTQVDIFDSVEALAGTEKNLMNEAQQAVAKAHAPYSRFYVGAAVLLGNEMVVRGNNQENAAYPSGLCAERVALFYASSQYPDQKVVSVAVAGPDHVNSEHILSPCGACRQALAEYETKFNSPIKVIMQGEKGKIYVSQSIQNLLPLMFNNINLK